MKRISPGLLLALVTSAILFAIPFFWFSSGEVDLGGDSGRLYYYDPIGYLKSQALYNVTSSGTGGEAISYFSIPYILLLAAIKALLRSPTLVIAFDNGVKIAVAFLAVYLTVRALISTESGRKGKLSTDAAAIVSGLFYVFSPLVTNRFERAILSHHQTFLNPLMFYLMLMFLTSKHRFRYGAAIVGLGFVFSLNFSYVAAPAIMSFYPLSFLFLVIYTVWIRRIRLPVKKLAFLMMTFIGIQSFHLMPHLFSLLTFRSEAFSNVYSEAGKYGRGLDYFLGIAPNIKLSVSFLGFQQMIPPTAFVKIISILSPFLVVFGLFLSRSKTMLLVAAAFMVTVFFYTANITQTGFALYVKMFAIPGFSMFRNYFGQWAFAYVFYFSLALGCGLGEVLRRNSRIVATAIAVYAVLAYSGSAVGFLNGTVVRSTHHETKEIPTAFRMDPAFEQVLADITLKRDDTKILGLPLPVTGYQVVRGQTNGVYAGISMFSYLAGVSEFSGYEGLSPYGLRFLRYVRDGEDDRIQRLFSIFNIGTVFHNRDTEIYDDAFPKNPYTFVRQFMPNTQAEYGQFLDRLPIDTDRATTYSDRYTLYPVAGERTLPHIYATDRLYPTNDDELVTFSHVVQEDPRATPVKETDGIKGYGQEVIAASRDSLYSELLYNQHLHRHEPFVSKSPASRLYPLVLFKEDLELGKTRHIPESHMNALLLLLTKRIAELEQFTSKLSVLHHPPSESAPWMIWKSWDTGSWESALNRYEFMVPKIREWIRSQDKSEAWKQAQEVKVREQLYQHERRLYAVIATKPQDDENRYYLFDETAAMFRRLYDLMDNSFLTGGSLQYSVTLPSPGQYRVYADDLGLSFGENGVPKLSGAEGITLTGTLHESGAFDFGTVELESGDMQMDISYPMRNLTPELTWYTSAAIDYDDVTTKADIRNDIANNSGIISQLIPWRKERQYLLSFEYQTQGEDIVFSLIERVRQPKSDIENLQVLEGRNLASEEWNMHQVVVTSDLNTLGAYLQFQSGLSVRQANIDIRNVTLVEVPAPHLYFVRIGQNQSPLVMPEIVVDRVNPTRYGISVRGASGPFALVFLEAYNPNWRLYDPEGSLAPLVAPVRTALDALAELFFGMEPRSKSHRNRFLYPEIFTTWGQDAIAEARHVRAHGYANAWVVTPEDTGHRTDFRLVLEMSTQKYVYMFLPVPILVGAGAAIYAIHHRRRQT